MELGKIPAPSNYEEKRAEFCKNWLEKQGAKGVYIDEALNVVYPVGNTESGPLVVFMAHTDVVFPDTEELPMRIEDGKLYCPGIGDDTIHLVALLMTAKYIAQNNLVPKEGGMLLVANAGEEGLGNLKGCKKIFEQYGSRVTEFVTFDGPFGPNATGGKIATVAVGSKRYKIEIDTEGGHSYSKFGNRNAIAYLASLIDTLYTIKVPSRGKTTYNVGLISGGTSVNTIAQHAEMLYEFRSDNREDLAEMEEHLNAALAFYATKGIKITTSVVGSRPCGIEVDQAKHDALIGRAVAATEKYFGFTPVRGSASTDCNIPLSMGIPSIELPCGRGFGAHTREEYIEIDSQVPGIKLAFEMILYHM
ncbi:MAG: M20/M25/M40 family metallo-hydrolase [Oscillospiraceae bacterium]|nr:M20/M25/M40 family metallo-hydrolase [Oscillospiraceae bacterium]